VGADRSLVVALSYDDKDSSLSLGDRAELAPGLASDWRGPRSRRRVFLFF